jgi:hypothetical protein
VKPLILVVDDEPDVDAQGILLILILECAPGGGQFQAAVLTGCRV